MSLTNRSECTYATLALGIGRNDQIADGLHQVGLAEPHAPVDEQRVVAAARVAPDLQRRGARQLVALALDEAIERERRVQPAAERRSARGRASLRLCDGRFAANCGPCTDLDYNLAARSVLRPPRPNLLEAVAFHPIDYEAIRREQTQQGAALHRLQRPNPRVELLLRQLRLEHACAVVPKRQGNGRVVCHGSALASEVKWGRESMRV